MRILTAAIVLVALSAILLFMRRSGPLVAPASPHADPAARPPADPAEPIAGIAPVPQPEEALAPPRAPERQPAPEKAPWIARFTVVDPQGAPVADAHIEMRLAGESAVAQLRTTDARGLAQLEVPQGLAVSESGFVATVAIGRPDFEESFHALGRGSFGSSGIMEQRVVLHPAGRIRIVVLDQYGTGVPAASVLFEARGKIEDSPLRLNKYQRFTDGTGTLEMGGLHPGTWSVHVGGRRDWHAAAMESVTLEQGTVHELELLVERFDPQTYISGRVLSPLLVGPGWNDTAQLHFRQVGSQQPSRECSLYDDGAFYLFADASKPYGAWELVRYDGSVCSPPLHLVLGQHGVAVVPTCP